MTTDDVAVSAFSQSCHLPPPPYPKNSTSQRVEKNSAIRYRIRLYLGVQVAQSLDISEVAGGVLVSGLESSVVVLDDGVEQVVEESVRLGIGSVDTDARVQVLHTYQLQLKKTEKNSGQRGSFIPMTSSVNSTKDYFRFQYPAQNSS